MTTGVWGAGVEGLAAARVLIAEGADVIVVDEHRTDRPLSLDPAALFAGGESSLRILLDCEEAVVSPGVPRTHPFRKTLGEGGVRLTSLSDRWMAHAGQFTIGVTGTKGKSTTTTLVALLLRVTGVDVRVGGNIGVPLTDSDASATVTVAELSSYQCASLRSAPRIAIITSLFEDHLTWHGSKQAYWEDKARIFGPGCEALVCDDTTRAALRSVGSDFPYCITPAQDELSIRISVARLPPVLQLAQNLRNLTLAVLAVDRWLGRPLSEAEILKATTQFRPLPHRLERIAERRGVTWVDDTLSTVPESVVAACEAFPGNIALILGGEDRGVDYEVLDAYLIDRKPRAEVIVIPSNGNLLATRYERAYPHLVHHCSSLEEGVKTAARVVGPGWTVLLSPGAPSYDNYINFEEKSRAFSRAIGRLDSGGDDR